jgi:hypothetical protein
MDSGTVNVTALVKIPEASWLLVVQQGLESASGAAPDAVTHWAQNWSVKNCELVYVGTEWCN